MAMYTTIYSKHTFNQLNEKMHWLSNITGIGNQKPSNKMRWAFYGSMVPFYNRINKIVYKTRRKLR